MILKAATGDGVNQYRWAESRFFDLSLDLLCIAGVDGYFKHLNPTWEETLGFTQTELFGKTLY